MKTRFHARCSPEEKIVALQLIRNTWHSLDHTGEIIEQHPEKLNLSIHGLVSEYRDCCTEYSISIADKVFREKWCRFLINHKEYFQQNNIIIHIINEDDIPQRYGVYDRIVFMIREIDKYILPNNTILVQHDLIE